MDSNSDSSFTDKNSKTMFDNILEFGAIHTINKKRRLYTISIIGEIEGHNLCKKDVKTTKYEHIIPQLVYANESDDIDGILFILNTIGGDVEAGLSIAEMISGLTKPTISFVVGGAHSIGIPLAVSTKKSIIASSATMLVHPVQVEEKIIGTKETFDRINDVRDRIINFITKHSKITKEKFMSYMFNKKEMASEIGTILNSEEVVTSGIINEIGDYSTCINRIDEILNNNIKN